MLKRRLFNANNSDHNLNLTEEMTPNKGGIHPALISVSSPAVGTKKSNKRTTDVQPAKTPEITKKSKPDSGASAEGSFSDNDSDSEALDVPGFFSNSVQKLPYTKEEDEMIVKYVLKGQNIFKVGSILLWKHLETKKGNPRRSYHSLKNRFLRNIKPLLFTNYGHLTKDKATIDRILTKFPELKHSLGRREILSNIKLPERKPAPKPTEEDGVSSTSANNFRESEERVAPVRSPEPDDVFISVVHSQRTQREPNGAGIVNPNAAKSVVYERTITTEGSNIIVSVDFKSKKYVETPSLGLYETYEKLKRKNRFGFCPTCGRYSTPKRGRAFNYNKETDVIPNSVETPEPSSKSSNKKIFGLRFKDNTTPKQRRTNSEPAALSPLSPSLLSDAGEGRENDRGGGDKTGENSKVATPCSRKDAGGSKVSQKSSSVTPAEKAEGSESRSKMLRMATQNSRSAKEGNSRTAKRRRDSDDEMESICEDALTNFRKLINDEEEQQLVRKCLNRNFKSIGLEDVSQANWDSYFLESSSDMDTPPLTIDYETDQQNSGSVAQSGKTSSSSPSKSGKKTSGKKRKP